MYNYKNLSLCIQYKCSTKDRKQYSHETYVVTTYSTKYLVIYILKFSTKIMTYFFFDKS